MAIAEYPANLPALNEPLKPQSQQEQQQCPFLDLPSELRNRIYELVFFSNNNTTIEVRKSYNTPALLSTCKQIRGEAGSLYYGTAIFSVKAEKGSDNQFVHRTPSGLCVLWLVTRAFQASRLIRQVRLDLSYTGASAWMDVWRRIALQIVRDQIVLRKLGEGIQVETIGGEVCVRSY